MLERLLPPVLAALLRAAKVPLRWLSHLHAERKAGQIPSVPDLTKKIFDNTLDRLRGGHVDESWLQNIKHKLAQRYVSPSLLRSVEVQEWLSDKKVSEDLKALATAHITSSAINDQEIKARLNLRYSDMIGDSTQPADDYIDTVVAVLVAGYLAQVPDDQRPVAGMVQQISRGIRDQIDQFEKTSTSNLLDPITQESHTNHARQELSKILLLRAFDPTKCRGQIQELQSRVGEGDLSTADQSTKSRVSYWAARLCASDADTVPLATEIRNEIHRTIQQDDLSILDALLAEASGDMEKALRLLRDEDNPDSRAVLFGMLVRVRDEHAALGWYANGNPSGESTFFTPLGWRTWAYCMAKTGKWEEAARHLHNFDPHYRETPGLAVVEGIVNAAILLPDEYRDIAFETVPFYRMITPNLVENVEQYHSHAAHCFSVAEESLEDIAHFELKDIIADWRTWVRLMNPDPTERTIVGRDIQQDMKEGPQAVKLMKIAWAFNITFDAQPLHAYLAQRKRLGGLEDDEITAECLLSEQSMSARDLTGYLERHEEHLTRMMPLATVTLMRIDALVKDGQTERAHSLVTDRAETLGREQCNRLIAMIDATDGIDPREQLEKNYRDTNSVADLGTLVSHLKSVGDHTAIRPLVVELFRKEKTVENALDLVICLRHPAVRDHQSTIEFLESNPDVLERSTDLKAEHAWALFHVGKLQEAKAVNTAIRAVRENQIDFHLDINIAIASGYWEHLGGIVDREWPRRDSLDPEILISLAQLAGYQDPTPDRPLGLARLAAQRAPDDPRILMGAYGLHVQLGCDEKADPRWLSRASDLSSTEEGPIWRVGLREAITDWIPKRRQHIQEMERKWLRGEIPISIAAGSCNVSLAWMLLRVSDQNTKIVDCRKRSMLPIIAVGRKRVELEDHWTVGLDVTSIMILHHLDLLRSVMGACYHIKLAPDVMECLFRDRDTVRFRQPSRVAAAREILSLYGRQRLRVADTTDCVPETIVDEVGSDVASLLHAAKKDNGRVICVMPVHRVDSLMEQEADLGEYSHFIHSLVDLGGLLHDNGQIAGDVSDRLVAFLNNQGQQGHAALPASAVDSPIYLDGVSLSYLQSAKALEPIATAGLDLRVHPSVLDEMRAFIEEDDTVEYLTSAIENIRSILRDAVYSGSASFLPRIGNQDPQIQERDYRSQPILSLVAASASCDALCIDDQFFNRHQAINDANGRSVPIACISDVLSYLLTHGHIDPEDYRSARHKLRQSGVSFLPHDHEEMMHWLRSAKVTNDKLIESMELRVLRQTLAWQDSLEIIDKPATYARNRTAVNTCRQLIFDIWKDETITIEHATILSDWVSSHLTARAIPDREHFIQGEYAEWIRAMVLLRLWSLVLPLPFQSEEHFDYHKRWIERYLLQPLRPANADLIEEVLGTAYHAVSNREKDRKIFGSLFLEQLPESDRSKVIAQDPEFAKELGFETVQVINLPDHGKVRMKELFAVVRNVFATNEEQMIENTDKKQLSVSTDLTNQNVVVKWANANDGSHEMLLSDLSLLSPQGETRIAQLGSIIGRLGPTGPDYRYLREDIVTRELTDQEINAIIEELSGGVAVVQAALIRKTTRREPIGILDIVPNDLSYFERFVGPTPDGREPEDYLRDVLIPYRESLLKRNLREGLDICCLGALRDDLLPGAWVADIDNGTLWAALSSCRAKDNPFSLLGALDIALYRQDDDRFREFAEEAVNQLLEENSGREVRVEPFTLLHIFYDLILNRINLLENGASNPGYWKRMCAWMQAGVVVRAMTQPSLNPDISALQQWARNHMVPAGAMAGLVDAKIEPRIFARYLIPEGLHYEIISRLQILKLRHEGEGHDVPGTDKIADEIERAKSLGLGLFFRLPGPLESHLRIAEPLPAEMSKELEDQWCEDSMLLQPVVVVAQLFALGERELLRVRDIVTVSIENIAEGKTRETLVRLEMASIVAVANRDTRLADCIVDAIKRIAPKLHEENDIQHILQIVLLVAGAHEGDDAWFQWLDEKLTSVAFALSSSQDRPQVYS